jgi:hypothetical protein
MDVAGLDHGALAFRAGAVLDAAEGPPLALAEDPAVAFPRLAVALAGPAAVAFLGFLGDSGTHSKTSVVWNIEDVFSPPIFQNLRGFSSFFRDFDQAGLYITLG